MLCAQCVCAQCDCAFNFSLWLLWHNNEYIILQLESPGMRRKGNIEKILSLCYSIVYYYNGAQRYEQFLQVGRLCRALILLGLALYHPSASVSSVFIVLHIFNFFVTFLLVSELSLVRSAVDFVD